VIPRRRRGRSSVLGVSRALPKVFDAKYQNHKTSVFHVGVALLGDVSRTREFASRAIGSARVRFYLPRAVNSIHSHGTLGSWWPHTLNPSSLKHLRCASMRYLHFSSSFSGKHASRACFVMGHAQQIFFGFTSACLLADAPIVYASRGRPRRRNPTATSEGRRRAQI